MILPTGAFFALSTYGRYIVLPRGFACYIFVYSRVFSYMLVTFFLTSKSSFISKDDTSLYFIL
jgi:hypothetical protein